MKKILIFMTMLLTASSTIQSQTDDLMIKNDLLYYCTTDYNTVVDMHSGELLDVSYNGPMCYPIGKLKLRQVDFSTQIYEVETSFRTLDFLLAQEIGRNAYELWHQGVSQGRFIETEKGVYYFHPYD